MTVIGRFLLFLIKILNLLKSGTSFEQWAINLKVLQQMSDKTAGSILIIDDGSVDNTYGQAEAFRKKQKIPFLLTILKNPIN